jgi:hypothetical protein
MKMNMNARCLKSLSWTFFFTAVFLLLLPFIYLLEQGQQPVFAQSSDNDAGTISVPLESQSDQGTFLVKMMWTTTKDLGSNNTFEIQFIEPETHKQLEEIVYDFVVISERGHEIVHRQSQTSPIQHVIFSSEGSYAVRIANIDGLGEDSNFSIRVTPEFHLDALPVVALGISIAIIFAKKFHKRL